MNSSSLFQLFQSGALAGVVTFFLGILTPFIEQTPFGKPSSSTHDATLRLLNLLLNCVAALLVAYALGHLASGSDILAALGFALAQATGSHVLYDTTHTSTGSGSGVDVSSGDPVAAAASASAQAALASSMQQAAPASV